MAFARKPIKDNDYLHRLFVRTAPRDRRRAAA